MEELLWFQKSRAEWLKCGDKNTFYFHNRTLIKGKRNIIEGLLIGDDWCFDEGSLKSHVWDFFMGIYSMDYKISGVFPCRNMFLVLPVEEMNSLLNVASNEEIHKAVFGMAPLKATGMDEF